MMSVWTRTPANYVPLTPLSFLVRSAAVYPNHVSVVYEDRSLHGRKRMSAAGALRRILRARASARRYGRGDAAERAGHE